MSESLPALRQELSLLPGPTLPDGQPSWTLHDPVRNLFFQLDWSSVEMLKRWDMAPAALLDEIRRETSLQLDETQLAELLQFLQQNQLLMIAPGVAATLAERWRQRQGTLWQWLLHNYLFFRIPLLRPDAWLTRMSPRVDFFFSRPFAYLSLLAGLLGLFGVLRSWQSYSATLVEMFSWSGALAYGATLTGVKVLHELGHGFTAKRYGCRVPTMGVAFLVMWPVAYTDTNEVWRLTSRRQRVGVAAAGILTELTVAVWASLLWCLLPDGALRTAAFLLSSTTWISTLLINASPFMRFDGYFLLADALQIPNLHQRAFALARWDLRERLFALGAPLPELFPRLRHVGLILFAWGTWIYRLTLFLGIAFLVYHFFIKAVGILLFLVEMIWFVAKPFLSEFRVWREIWPQVRSRPATRRSLLLATILLLLFAVPWPTRVQHSAVLYPAAEQVFYAPRNAQLSDMHAEAGAAQAAGVRLFDLHSPELELRARQARARSEQLDWLSGASAFDDERRKDWQVLKEQLGTSQAEQKSVDADSGQYHLSSSGPGVLRDRDPDLRAGDWLSPREVLGRISGQGFLRATVYVDDEDLARIASGDRAVFTADGGSGPNIRLRVLAIDSDATRTLAEGELASLFGGSISVREKHGALYPERAIYRVQLQSEIEYPPQQHRWRGQVAIAGDWEAPGLRYLRQFVAVLWRESGF
jgi:putative peptide zinc metalloprotease protein